jgi:hypothetical protein
MERKQPKTQSKWLAPLKKVLRGNSTRQPEPPASQAGPTVTNVPGTQNTQTPPIMPAGAIYRPIPARDNPGPRAMNPERHPQVVTPVGIPPANGPISPSSNIRYVNPPARTNSNKAASANGGRTSISPAGVKHRTIDSTAPSNSKVPAPKIENRVVPPATATINRQTTPRSNSTGVLSSTPRRVDSSNTKRPGTKLLKTSLPTTGGIPSTLNQASIPRRPESTLSSKNASNGGLITPAITPNRPLLPTVSKAPEIITSTDVAIERGPPPPIVIPAMTMNDRLVSTSSKGNEFRDEQIYVPLINLPRISETSPNHPTALSLADPKTVEAIARNNRRIVIRVITPSSAQSRDVKSILLYNDGKPIPLSTTLRQLKVGIARLLNVNGLSLPPKTTAATPMRLCNCAFASTIVTYGVWEMLRCRIHDSEEEGCDYPHKTIVKDKICLLCHTTLTERCQHCELGDISDCPLVVNAGCNHTFHHHCYTQHTNETCPGGCAKSMFLKIYLTIGTTQREMTITSRQRSLFVIHGRNQFKVIKLDQNFGGRGSRAEVSLSQLKDSIRREVNTGSKESCMHVLNGLKEG